MLMDLGNVCSWKNVLKKDFIYFDQKTANITICIPVSLVHEWNAKFIKLPWQYVYLPIDKLSIQFSFSIVT